ncbi:MAG: hypothetical protein N2Z65_04475 [Clostridiales bacterium]|nr:hypothetical protein [Clostridiales bacterium]
MKDNNINWSGNKVMNQGSSYQPSRPMMPDQSTMPDSSMMDRSSTMDRSQMTDRSMPGGGMQASPFAPIDPMYGPSMTQQGPPPATDRMYIPGYLSSIIGRNIRAEFLIGENLYMDRSGKLVEVGANYFVLEEFITGNRVMCDLYSVKFVTVR